MNALQTSKPKLRFLVIFCFAGLPLEKGRVGKILGPFVCSTQVRSIFGGEDNICKNELYQEVGTSMIMTHWDRMLVKITKPREKPPRAMRAGSYG